MSDSLSDWCPVRAPGAERLVAVAVAVGVCWRLRGSHAERALVNEGTSALAHVYLRQALLEHALAHALHAVAGVSDVPPRGDLSAHRRAGDAD